MSERELRRRRMLSIVFLEAWKYKKSSTLYELKFSSSLLIAWKTVRSKIKLCSSNVRGVSFYGRQNILKKLALLSPSEILIKIAANKESPFDVNELDVLVSVKGSEFIQIGCIPRQLAAELSRGIMAGRTIFAFFDCISGLQYNNGYLGCIIKYALI